MLKPFRYPIRKRATVFLGLLVSMLAILGGMIWRNLDRLERIHAYVNYSHQVEAVALDLQTLLAISLSGRHLDAEPRLARLKTELAAINTHRQHLSPQTPERIAAVANLLDGVASQPTDDGGGRLALVSALGAMGQIMDDETEQRGQALERLRKDTLTELNLAMATLAAILVLAAWFFHKRIRAPLHDLRQLLGRLAAEDFRPIATDHLDPLLEPVFASYNDMVEHLAELEEAKRQHADSLRAEVRSATQALLEQQRSLARAERLAAVGEVAAELAHELRNPLAGIQVACANLRRELHDGNKAERLDLIVGELKRLAGLLNRLLEPSRHAPAMASDFDAVGLVRELAVLARYQIPDHIQLELELPDSLPVHLPECGLRQALLNLILNAAEALGAMSGKVRIALIRNGKNIGIYVADDGPGFNTELLEQGIRPFRTSRPDGTGLGLAVVQRYVREQGGRLKLENHQPHGAEVTMFFSGVARD